ncbi:MAG: OmpH family outer membrane protein [Candidatus Caldatribacterium sp.]|uniref:OmpH family outer membrane protein n=1 Tax=Candidatus Caldatribacterium sp. TaxID=2282143 RepID=UPI00299367C0|nr:OmpH family outer membrane protein [Candidatus Caldatribacterium sp.]MCX7729723.1 OmpH family outer membrane protein [Candidatus Caldatribacterium sp.]MDW8080396.1 OmpH family outer membrane protein [Candidatus Calescibacterium sp.]
MKRNIARALGVICFVIACMNVLAFAQTKKAAPAPSPSVAVGVVDINKVFDAHPNTAAIAEVEKKIAEEFQKRQQELNEKGKGKTREEVQKLEEEMNAAWVPVRDAMLKERQALIEERYGDVIAAIRKVAESMQLALVIRSTLRIPVNQKEVLEMPLVLYGGTDITEAVIQELKNIVAAKAKEKK